MSLGPRTCAPPNKQALERLPRLRPVYAVLTGLLPYWNHRPRLGEGEGGEIRIPLFSCSQLKP